ncbi:MAG: hypothetical protein IT332_05010 [Ardenticatenales bacterium]|nr:hypothetical protein [Ardenticatenales bacterium]
MPTPLPRPSPYAPPTGTVTFLFTDIEGSTTRWEHHRAAMERALDRHNAIVGGAIHAHHGHVFKTVGDAYCAAFAAPDDAVTAAVAAQRALAAEDWSACGPDFPFVRVRMGLHTGAAEYRAGDDDYVGPPLNRAARLMSAGHGGQVLLSLATQQLVRDNLPDGARLVDLGVHRLKGLRHTEHLFRLVAPGMPDITTPPDTAEALGATASAHAHVDVASLPAACPYRGLHAFREADAPFFFGREAFTDLLVDAVATAPMVGVIGPSGSGKSSVVFAGLVPRLRTRTDNGSSTPTPWTVLELRPGSRPFHSLAGAWLPLLVDDGTSEIDRLAELNKLAEHLRAGSIAPHDVLARIGDRRPDVGRLLLVADQFEELYTLCADESEHRSFQDLLFAAAFEQRTGPPLTLALTLRADFMGHALAYRPFADAIQKHDVKLGPMNRDELARAIRMPAEAQGRAFESGLVERIVDDVGEKAGTLPLLEFALTKLWDEQHAGWLTHEAYEAIGRVEGAVARHADAVYAGLAESDCEPARRVFVQLVQPGEGTEDTRRLAVREELDKDWGLVQQLADARLVTTGRDDAGHETAEVVHEALIRSWERLREWINADRRFRTWQERLRIALRQWESVGDDEGALLRGAPLAEAEGWFAERRADLTDAERRFIEAGVELRDREVRERHAQLEREADAATRLRRQRVFLSVALVAAGALAVAALALGQAARTNAGRADQERDRALARELAGASVANRTTDPELSVLLALRAISVSQLAGGVPVPGPERALHLALQHTRRRQTLMAHEGGVNDVAVSPDGRRLATCGKDGIKLWDLATGQTVLTITQAITTVTTVAFSPDGAVLASGGPDRVVRLWRSATGESVRQLEGHTDAVMQVAFSPDGSRLASASRDKSVLVWDARTGGRLLSLKGHRAVVNSVDWSPDGARLATASKDFSVQLWDATSGIVLLRLLTPSEWATSSSVAFSPDGTWLAAGGSSLRIWDAETGDLRQVLQGHRDVVSEIVFSPDGTRLLSASADKTAGVWEVRGYGSSVEPLSFRLGGHSGTVGDVAITPDGQQAVTSSADGTIGVWDLMRSQAWRTLRGTASSPAVAFSPDGRSVAAASRDGVARIWSLENLSTTAAISLTGHVSDVVDVAFSPDSDRVATAGYDKTARLWETDTGTLVRVFAGHSDWVTGLAFSADGLRLSTASKDRTAMVWNVNTGASLLTLTGHGAWVNKVAYSPDGSQLATASDDRSARTWDAVSGKELLTLTGHAGNVVRIAYAPDGRRILTTSDSDRTARVWSAVTGRELVAIRSHTRPIQGGTFSPDGLQLATSSWDGTVSVWDSNSGEELLTVAEASGLLLDAAFSPDGAHLAVGSLAGNVYIYTLRLDELIALAHERVKRSLTEEECRKYLHVEACPADLTRPGAR